MNKAFFFLVLGALLNVVASFLKAAESGLIGTWLITVVVIFGLAAVGCYLTKD